MGWLGRELCRLYPGHRFVAPTEDTLDELWFCEECGASGMKVKDEAGVVRVIERRFKVG